MTELIVVEQLKAIDIFKAGGIKPILDQIEKKATKEVFDAKTKKGRDSIRSMAANVAKSKKALDGFGKDLADKLNAQLKPINAERKLARDELDKLRDAVRQPLTEFENAEKSRIEKHEFAIAAINNTASADLDLSQMKSSLENMSAIDATAFEEYETAAEAAKAKTVLALTERIAAQEKHEAEQAELEKLRALQAEREQKDRDEAIAREAAEKAEREAAEALEQAELAAEQARQQAAKEAQDKIDAAERATQQALEQAELAAANERKRIADEIAENDRATKAREANKKHRATINNGILKALMAEGFNEKDSKKFIELAAKRMLPNIEVKY